MTQISQAPQTPKKPELYEIWLESNPTIPELPWRMQLINYVGQFPTEAKAQEYKDKIEFERKKFANLENLRKK